MSAIQRECLDPQALIDLAAISVSTTFAQFGRDDALACVEASSIDQLFAFSGHDARRRAGRIVQRDVP